MKVRWNQKGVVGSHKACMILACEICAYDERLRFRASFMTMARSQGRNGFPRRKRPIARYALRKPVVTASSASSAEPVTRYAVLNAIPWCMRTSSSNAPASPCLARATSSVSSSGRPTNSCLLHRGGYDGSGLGRSACHLSTQRARAGDCQERRSWCVRGAKCGCGHSMRLSVSEGPIVLRAEDPASLRRRR